MPYVAFQPIPPQFQDASSVNLSGGTLEFYLAGTSTPTNIYSDNAGTSLGTSVTLNASGYPESGGNVVALYRDTAVDLKVVLKDATAATLWTSDDIDQPTADMFSILDSGGLFPSATTIEAALAEARGNIQTATADSAKTSDTTLGNDAGFSAVTLTTAAFYEVELWLPYNQNVGDLKYALTFSNSPNPNRGILMCCDVSGTQLIQRWTITSGPTITTMTDNQEVSLWAFGTFQANTSSGGTVTPQWAQNTSSANATTLREGRIFRIRRIG